MLGIVLAQVRVARSPLSLPCALESMRRMGNTMFDWKRKLVAVMVGLMLSVGAFAQKDRGGDKRPPKDENRVVVQPKGEKPPQNNNNQGDRGRGDKKGKP